MEIPKQVTEMPSFAKLTKLMKQKETHETTKLAITIESAIPTCFARQTQVHEASSWSHFTTPISFVRDEQVRGTGLLSSLTPPLQKVVTVPRSSVTKPLEKIVKPK